MKGFAAGSDSFYFQRKASHFTLLWEMCVTVSCCCYLRDVSITCSSQLLVCTLYCPVLSSRSGTGFEACTAQFFCGKISTSQCTGLNSALRCLSAMNTYMGLNFVLPSFCCTAQLCVKQISISQGTGMDSVLSRFCRADLYLLYWPRVLV